MAIRSKTPSTPAKRGKTISSQDAPAATPAKTKAKRNGSAAQHAKTQSAPASDATPPSAVQEQTFEAPPEYVEHQPAVAAEPDVSAPEAPKSVTAEPGAEREDRASRALNAIKTLGEMIAEGIDTLTELRAEMREMSGRLDQLAAGMPKAGQGGAGSQQQRPEAADTADADDYQVGRDRDPGDAVPPGVAVVSPTPLTETDEAALHSLEELPKRTGRGKRGPRAKA